MRLMLCSLTLRGYLRLDVLPCIEFKYLVKQKMGGWLGVIAIDTGRWQSVAQLHYVFLALSRHVLSCLCVVNCICNMYVLFF